MRPNKTERERECEKSSESETVRQRDRVKRWPGQNLLGSSRPHARLKFFLSMRSLFGLLIRYNLQGAQFA